MTVNKKDYQPALVVKHLYKSFKLPIEQYSGIKQLFINIFNKRAGHETQHVLNDVSFEIKKGEFFGIVGRNGSGKSTLLKLLAGIYEPDKGHVSINGSLTPFIELGVGFNPELTGKENVFLNGALLGFDRKYMISMYDDIVEFAELERFMDQKLKNYSSGMQVRLAFSIAIRAKSDILLIDEVLAVGDADFQKKCLNVFRSLKKEGRTIILVTHDMSNVERFCDRALVIDKVGVVTLATPSDASLEYAKLNINESASDSLSSNKEVNNRWGLGGIKIKNIYFDSISNVPVFNYGDKLEVFIDIEKEKDYQSVKYDVGLAIINQDNVTVAGPNTIGVTVDGTGDRYSYLLDKLPLQPGDYTITTAVVDKETGEPFDFIDKVLSFHVISDKSAQGLVDIGGVWSKK
jgi:ABC-2 type transport system ATP-binding protein